MQVRTKTKNSLDLKYLVIFQVAKNKDAGFRSEFFINESGELQINLYKKSLSNQEPCQSSKYEIIKEGMSEEICL